MLTSARPPTRAWEVARTVVAPPLSVVKCLWEVFVWGSCRARVCAGVVGVFLCRCVLCACDLLIVLYIYLYLYRYLSIYSIAPASCAPFGVSSIPLYIYIYIYMLTSARPPTRAWEVARTVVAPPLSVVKCLWEVFVWGSCRARVCAGVGGVLLCRCVRCACDLLIVLYIYLYLYLYLSIYSIAPASCAPFGVSSIPIYIYIYIYMLTSARPPTRAWEVARTVVAPPLSVVKCLWEVFVWGSCRARVCAGVGVFSQSVCPVCV